MLKFSECMSIVFMPKYFCLCMCQFHLFHQFTDSNFHLMGVIKPLPTDKNSLLNNSVFDYLRKINIFIDFSSQFYITFTFWNSMYVMLSGLYLFSQSTNKHLLDISFVAILLKSMQFWSNKSNFLPLCRLVYKEYSAVFYPVTCITFDKMLIGQ